MPPIKKILIEEDRLASRVQAIAGDINQTYQNVDELIVISVLKGSVMFMADLIKHLHMDVEIGFLFLSSYGGGTTSSGNIQVFDIPIPNLTNRHVILVEDIYDTGASLKYAYDLCNAHAPASLRTCVLLEKEKEGQIACPIDFSGFKISDEFVVGYGLDYQEKYRNLPYIGVLPV